VASPTTCCGSHCHSSPCEVELSDAREGSTLSQGRLKLARSATRPTSTSPDAIDLSWITDLQTVASAAADAEAAAQRDVDRHADKVRMHERRTAEAQRVADGFARELANAREKHDAALTALAESAKKRKAAAEKYEKAKAGVRAILADVDVSTTDG
jgi:hypothetical protein